MWAIDEHDRYLHGQCRLESGKGTSGTFFVNTATTEWYVDTDTGRGVRDEGCAFPPASVKIESSFSREHWWRRCNVSCMAAELSDTAP